MIRQAIVAGQFYPDKKDEIISLINTYNRGIDEELPLEIINKNIIAGIVPHAGYFFSGKCANKVFYAIKKSSELLNKNIDTFIILGPNHTGVGRTGISNQDWETPLGIVKVNHDMINKLTNSGLIVDNSGHEFEHSIEVQLPFIKHYFPGSTIIPVIISSELSVAKVADALANVISKEENKNICIIASSDFTHYGSDYGYMPFTYDVKNNMAKLDKEAISYILNLDKEKFYSFLKNTGATICGFMPIATIIETLNKIKTNKTVYNPSYNIKAKLLEYYTSGDVVGNYKNCVGYAGIVFYNP